MLAGSPTLKTATPLFGGKPPSLAVRGVNQRVPFARYSLPEPPS
ncbi:MAG: hypothetical protein QXV81_07615 [Ignisphaera sp.]